MQVVDVNVLVNAFYAAAPRHRETKLWLESALGNRETVGIPDVVVTGFVRIMTNPRALPVPLTPAQALDALGAIFQAPNVVLLNAGVSTWDIFEHLVRLHKLQANDIPDAWIAAIAIAEEATLISDDQDFARFGQLRWRTVSG